jgi:hypothetical protein
MHVLFFIFCSTEIGSIIKNTITQSVSRQDHYLYHCAFVDNVFGHEIKIYKASKRQDTPPGPGPHHAEGIVNPKVRAKKTVTDFG